MERELWLAGKMSEYRRLPLESKTIMFIEEYSFGAGGVITALFLKALKDPQYKDYRLVWTARDYETTIDQFGELIEDDRVVIVKREMPNFLRYLAVASNLYSSNTLPNYYIKREGQKIFTYMSLSAFVLPWYTKNQIRNLVPTINDSDHFICLDEYDENIYLNDYGVDPGKILRLDISEIFPVKDGSDRNMVIIAVSHNASLLKNGASFAGFIRKIKGIMDFYGKEIKVLVGNKFWKNYRSQKEYFGIEEIFCDDLSIAPYLGKACLLITDNTYRATQAQRINIPVVIWGGKPISERFASFYSDCEIIKDFKSLYKLFEARFGGLGVDGRVLYVDGIECDEGDDAASDKIGTDSAESREQSEDPDDMIVIKKHDDDSSDDESDDEESNEGADEAEVMIPPEKVFCRRAVDDVIPSGKNVLYVFRWEKDNKYIDCIEDWFAKVESEGQRATILFLNTRNQALYSSLKRMRRPHMITCRVGFYQSSEEERSMMTAKSNELDDYLENVSHEFISDEWKRLVGNVRYDLIIADRTTNYFWKKMYKYPPADELKLMGKEEKEAIFDQLISEKEQE